MELTKYRQFKDSFQDDGEEIFESLGAAFSPDFKNRNTIQLWDISNAPSVLIEDWKGITLSENTLHEITIVNNSNTEKSVVFSSPYFLIDEIGSIVNLGPNGVAHFYASGFMKDNNLLLGVRQGSQDKRNI